jgi:hypothetical protein
MAGGVASLAAPTVLAQTGDGLGAPGAPVMVGMISNEAFARQWQSSMVPEINKVVPLTVSPLCRRASESPAKRR